MTVKQRISSENVEVKVGLGWSYRMRCAIQVWHAVINGKTLASFETKEDAWNWVYNRYEIVTHGK